MCYAYQPDREAAAEFAKTAKEVLQQILQDGGVKESVNGFYYPKSNVEVIRMGAAGREVKAMRWDLIPWNFLAPDRPATVAEAVKRKNSRAKNPTTGKAWGYDAYNARLETVLTRNAFKLPFKKGKRCVMPVSAWRERPNMEGAPKEFTGREYEIRLDIADKFFLAGIFDTYTALDGETLDSCTVITGPSDEIPALQGIYHERTPIVLTKEAAEVWLDPGLTPEAAYAFLRGVTAPVLRIEEILRHNP